MTDKINKIQPLTEDVFPAFPTANGGYVEEVVDTWMNQHFTEVNQIIEYQNYGVDIVDALESELEEARAALAQAHAEGSAHMIDEVTNSDELDNLRSELATAKAELGAVKTELDEARARIAELEETPARMTLEEEKDRASILLQHATQLGANFVEQAKVDAENIRRDAEVQLVETRKEIEELNAQRFATLNSLMDFYSHELSKLSTHPLFTEAFATDEPEGDEAHVAAEGEADVTEDDEAVLAEDVAADEDVPAAEIPTDEESAVTETEDVVTVDGDAEEVPEAVEGHNADDEEDELDTENLPDEETPVVKDEESDESAK